MLDEFGRRWLDRLLMLPSSVLLLVLVTLKRLLKRNVLARVQRLNIDMLRHASLDRVRVPKSTVSQLGCILSGCRFTTLVRATSKEAH